MPKYRIELEDVEGHGYKRGPNQGPQAVTVRAAGGEEYPATLTMDDVEGHRKAHLDFGPDDVEGHPFKKLDQGPQAVTIKVAGGAEMTGTLMADDDDVEGHHIRKPTDFPNSTVP